FLLRVSCSLLILLGLRHPWSPSRITRRTIVLHHEPDTRLDFAHGHRDRPVGPRLDARRRKQRIGGGSCAVLLVNERAAPYARFFGPIVSAALHLGLGQGLLP